MPPGLQGTVAFIDDAGQIHMHWENGRSLAIVPGVDSVSYTHLDVYKRQIRHRSC